MSKLVLHFEFFENTKMSKTNMSEILPNFFLLFRVVLHYTLRNYWENRKTCPIKYQLDTIRYRKVIGVKVIWAIFYTKSI